MSFSPSANCRFPLIVLAITLLLGGCSLLGKNPPLPVPQDTPLAAPADSAPRPVNDSAAQGRAEATSTLVGQDASSDLLLPLEIVRGGPQGNALTGVRYAQFIRPVAVAARGNDLFVIDAGQELLFKYNRTMRSLDVVMSLRGVLAGEASDIYVARDLSFYIADPMGSRVLQFDRRGRLIRTYSNAMNLARPVAVSVEESSGRVLVADGVYDHILVFDSFGNLVASGGGRGSDPGQFLNITAMASGVDGFYVTARFGQRIQVLADDGRYRYSMPQGDVTFPTAIAVDGEGRVYVSDFIDNTVKIYGEGRLLGRIGKTGSGLGEFRYITDLWVDEGFLYVADSLNGRVQVLRVMSGAAGGKN